MKENTEKNSLENERSGMEQCAVKEEVLCRINGENNSEKIIILSKVKTRVTESHSIKERLCSEYTFQVRVKGDTQNGIIRNN